jgi:hypothetical protein
VVIVAAVLGTAASIEWVRFRMATPSLIDDWYAISYGRTAFRALIAGDYGSAHVDLVGRYRPAYSAIWNYAQWHLFGGPSIVAAAAWGAARIIAFVAAIALLARVVARRGARTSLWLLCLAPLAVALTPQIAVDLARHSPAEPLMVIGLVIGLAAICTGTRSIIRSGRCSVANVTMVAFGFALYVFGIYAKETSVAIVILVPFVLKAYGPEIRGMTRSSGRARALMVLGLIALAAPIVHLASHLLLTSSGHAEYAQSQATMPQVVLVAGVLPFLGAPAILGTVLWCIGVPVALAVSGQALHRRERDGWLLLGVLATGLAMSALALGRGDAPSRYYIPWIVAVAAVATRALARPDRKIYVALLGVAVLFIALTSTREALSTWAANESIGSAAVEMAQPVVSGGCPLYLARFDVERRVAVPRLLRFIHSPPRERCVASSQTAFALAWHSTRLPVGFERRCKGAWTVVEARDDVVLSRCGAFRGGHFLDQDEAAHYPMISVTRLRMPVGDAEPPSF